MSQAFYELLKYTQQAQRCLANIAITPESTSVRVSLEQIENKLLLEIRDFERRENQQETLALYRKGENHA